jgi:hypothetical protein
VHNLQEFLNFAFQDCFVCFYRFNERATLTRND